MPLASAKISCVLEAEKIFYSSSTVVKKNSRGVVDGAGVHQNKIQLTTITVLSCYATGKRRFCLYSELSVAADGC